MHSSGVHTAERLAFNVEGGGTEVDAEGVETRDELVPVGAHQADDRRERETRARRNDMVGGEGSGGKREGREWERPIQWSRKLNEGGWDLEGRKKGRCNLRGSTKGRESSGRPQCSSFDPGVA